MSFVFAISHNGAYCDPLNTCSDSACVVTCDVISLLHFSEVYCLYLRLNLVDIFPKRARGQRNDGSGPTEFNLGDIPRHSHSVSKTDFVGADRCSPKAAVCSVITRQMHDNHEPVTIRAALQRIETETAVCRYVHGGAQLVQQRDLISKLAARLKLLLIPVHRRVQLQLGSVTASIR